MDDSLVVRDNSHNNMIGELIDSRPDLLMRTTRETEMEMRTGEWVLGMCNIQTGGCAGLSPASSFI